MDQLQEINTKLELFATERVELVATFEKKVAELRAEIDKYATACNRLRALADSLRPFSALFEVIELLQDHSRAELLAHTQRIRSDAAQLPEHHVTIGVLQSIVTHLSDPIVIEQASHANGTMPQTIFERVVKVEVVLMQKERALVVLQEEYQKLLLEYDTRVTHYTEQRAELIQAAITSDPTIQTLMPTFNLVHLEDAAGPTCTICEERLGWPSDRALLGSAANRVHYAVQAKCCHQFVGESCARKLTRCPFCRAEPIAFDGSVNGIKI